MKCLNDIFIRFYFKENILTAASLAAFLFRSTMKYAKIPTMISTNGTNADMTGINVVSSDTFPIASNFSASDSELSGTDLGIHSKVENPELHMLPVGKMKLGLEGCHVGKPFCLTITGPICNEWNNGNCSKKLKLFKVIYIIGVDSFWFSSYEGHSFNDSFYT